MTKYANTDEDIIVPDRIKIFRQKTSHALSTATTITIDNLDILPPTIDDTVEPPLPVLASYKFRLVGEYTSPANRYFNIVDFRAELLSKARKQLLDNRYMMITVTKDYTTHSLKHYAREAVALAEANGYAALDGTYLSLKPLSVVKFYISQYWDTTTTPSYTEMNFVASPTTGYTDIFRITMEMIESEKE